MKIIAYLCSFSALSFAATDFTGKVKFQGTAPKPVPVRMQADSVCQKAQTANPVLKQDIQAGSQGGLANALVYIKEGVQKDKVPPVSQTEVLLDQKGCWYYPRVLGVRVGQPFKVGSKDATFHNVHAISTQGQGFNQGIATPAQSIPKKFEKPEVVVRFKCDVHGWMNAYVAVLDHPYFAVTGDDGAFKLADLPPGKYVVEAWHEKLGTQTAAIQWDGKKADKPVEFVFQGK